MERLLPLSSITAGSRFRQDYGDMPELCRSIRATKGLQFHFVVVEEINQEFHLRAGGRRFKAYEMLSNSNPEAWGVDAEGNHYIPTPEELKLYSSIPCTILTNLTYADQIKIEIIENRGRKATSWQEDAPAVKEYHTELQRIYGVGTVGKGKSGWSLRDTARELGMNPAEVVHLLKLATELKTNPMIKDITRRSKALTHIKRSKSLEIADLLQLGTFEERGVVVKHGDSKDIIPTLKNESIDLIITDPPWDIGFEDRISEERQSAYKRYDTGYNITDTLEVLISCYHKLKPNSGIYMFYSSFPDKVLEAQRLLTTAGFLIEEIPLIWYKKHILAHDARETRHDINYETIIYGWKGSRPLLSIPSRNVFEHQVAYKNRIHASEKPEALLAELILLNTSEGAMVLDPFGGSCKVADACLSNKRKCLVVELEEELVKLANMRLRGL